MIGFGQSSGTGFAINSKGYIATNFHVIDGAKSIQIIGINAEHQKSYNATIIKVDKANDLAILKVDANLGIIPYGFKRNKEDVAASIYAYGYPLPEIQGYELKITDGIINSNSGFMDDPRWYQHTASVQPGSSGGPLFNKYGNLVGVNNAGINNDFLRKQYGSEATNVNYAIKSRYLYNLMEDLDISVFVNNGINKMSLSEQYNKIKDFVYFISCPLPTEDYNKITDDSNIGLLYDFWSSLEEQINLMTADYQKKVGKYLDNEATYTDLVKQDLIAEITGLEQRIQAFQKNAEEALRRKAKELGVSYDDAMLKFEE